jgi:trk system potassium uptake protein TrkH
MNYKLMGRFIAQIILMEALFLLPALGISLGYGEMSAVYGFLLTVATALALGIPMYLFCRKTDLRFGVREGMVCVSLSWLVMSLLGALPFYFSGAIPKYIDAFFETASGFSTTGASILSDVESLPKGILYWRSFTHWVGGMGVLVFALAFSSGDQGAGFTMHLLRAESPGPDVGKLVPKMKQTAKILYIIYFVMTVLDIIFLLFGGLPLLDALCLGFGTAGTGGFGIKNDSFASYSPYIQDVTTVFMFLFGINFSCYFLLLMRQFKNVFRDEELRLYIGIALISALLIGYNTFEASFAGDFGEALRHSAFQVASLMSSTGYSTVDFDTWHTFSKGIILMLMLIGACAGSTGGGFKVARVLIVFKNLRRNIRQVANPRKVMAIRNNGKVMDEKVITNTNAYLAAYMIILVLATLVISLDGQTVETNISAVFACVNNIGPGLGAVGPVCNYSIYSNFSKGLLGVLMLVGRLEIFPFLILLSRSTWKRK